MSSEASPQWQPFWPWPGLVVLALAIIRAATRLRDLDLQIAGGAVSSPLGYVWLHLNPALAAVDWPAGSAEFRFSLPMRMLLVLIEAAHLSPESTIAPFAFIEMTLMLVGLGYLAHVLFGCPRTTVALVVVGALAPVAGVNLGNFGAGLGNYAPSLFYHWAHAFGFLTVAFFLRDRLIAAAAMAALAMWSHVAMGLYTVAFIGGAVMIEPARLAAGRVWRAILLFVVLCVPLVALLIGDAHLGTGGVAPADWLLMSRMFNWHWHPIEFGLFGPLSEIGIFPILALAFGYAIARRRVRAIGEGTDTKILAGMAVAGLLTTIGIVFSEVWPIPVLIKPALPRASEWISLIALVYIVRDLVRRTESGPWPMALVAGWTLAALVLGGPGIAVLPIALFGLADAIRDKARLRGAVSGAILLCLVLLAIGDTLFSDLRTALWTPLAHLSPFAIPDDGIAGGHLLRPWFAWVGLGVAIILVIGARPVLAVFPLARIAAEFLIAAGLLLLVQQARWEDWAAPNRDRLVAFKEAQLWAAANTAPDAVFIGDPAVANGWREYSGRAYYGALAELAHYATLYDSVPGLFERGLRRVREFGVDPMAVDPHALRLLGGGKYGASVLSPKVAAAFGRMGAAEFRAIARRHGVSYLVIQRGEHAGPLELKLVYSNAEYDIYDLRSGS
jgi:hypothetical protein